MLLKSPYSLLPLNFAMISVLISLLLTLRKLVRSGIEQTYGKSKMMSIPARFATALLKNSAL